MSVVNVMAGGMYIHEPYQLDHVHHGIHGGVVVGDARPGHQRVVQVEAEPHLARAQLRMFLRHP